METCPTCGTPYGKRRRCYRCQPGYRHPSYGRKRTGMWRPCPVCQNPVYAAACHLEGGRGARTYCSRACKAQAMQGQLFPNPKYPPTPIGSRRLTLDGYIQVKVAPGRGGWQFEHRLVAAEKYGRPIGKDEHVHHRNGLKSDNRASNLEVIDPGSHARLSNQQGVSARKALRQRLTELEAQVERYERLYGKLPAVLEQQTRPPVCEHCGTSYTPAKASHERRSRYCSKACRLAAMHVNAKAYHAERRPEPATCQHCGQMFAIPLYREGDAKYCSRACANAAHEKENPEQACERCGRMFRKRWAAETAKSQYCSRRCALAVGTEVRLKDYEPAEMKRCATCGQDYRPRYAVEAETSRYCSRACWRQRNRSLGQEEVHA